MNPTDDQSRLTPPAARPGEPHQVAEALSREDRRGCSPPTPPGVFIDCYDTDPGDCCLRIAFHDSQDVLSRVRESQRRDAQQSAALDAELRRIEASAPILWRGKPIVPSGLSWLGPAIGVSLVLAAIVYVAATWFSR